LKLGYRVRAGVRSAKRAVTLVQVEGLVDLNLLSIACQFPAIMTQLMTNFLQSVKQMKFEGDDTKEGFKRKKIKYGKLGVMFCFFLSK